MICSYIKQIFWILTVFYLSITIDSAVMAPPWANPQINPCAKEPGGWQLLFWPPNGKCYKIFQVGYPCPEGMELTPNIIGTHSQGNVTAECKCPPQTALFLKNKKCYKLFSSGPCEEKHYFAPESTTNQTSRIREGICKSVPKCNKLNEVFWPHTETCYEKLSRGPCPKGQLFTLNEKQLGECKCTNEYELSPYYDNTRNECYQHFTWGPCKERGQLFLPDKTCGCHRNLPHYHKETDKCFELGTIGPCDVGENFQLNLTKGRGTCMCKKGYIRYIPNNTCYRPFTQGPCDYGEFLVNTTTCMKQPCRKSYLYFPQNQQCFKVGTRGPCKRGKVVTFDFETRPSIDGISYNGVCNCEERYKDTCNDKSNIEQCSNETNLVLYQGKCYKLYKQGPCTQGAWLKPNRKKELWSDEQPLEGYCDCMPGFIKMIRSSNDRTITECLSQSVLLADYLKKNFFTYDNLRD